ncbi:hypothetical protein J3459_007767 [Metarhizium acridum]|nr:hypothetical protein J3459_007767 [Metarhizium acridum]
MARRPPCPEKRGELEGSHVPGVPQYEPQEQRKWLVLVVAWMTTLAGLAVMARLWCRRIRSQALWWDDYLMMFSTVTTSSKSPPFSS